jgi:hypothetical protein
MSTVIIFWYTFATLLQLGAGSVLVLVHNQPQYPPHIAQRRLGARMALTCWAWPIWAVVGIYTGVRRLLIEAI